MRGMAIGTAATEHRGWRGGGNCTKAAATEHIDWGKSTAIGAQRWGMGGKHSDLGGTAVVGIAQIQRLGGEHNDYE